MDQENVIVVDGQKYYYTLIGNDKYFDAMQLALYFGYKTKAGMNNVHRKDKRFPGVSIRTKLRAGTGVTTKNYWLVSKIDEYRELIKTTKKPRKKGEPLAVIDRNLTKLFLTNAHLKLANNQNKPQSPLRKTVHIVSDWQTESAT